MTRVIPCPPNVDPAVHAVLVARHWQLASPSRFDDRRREERRREPAGMAGVPGLDRRRGDRRGGSRVGRFERDSSAVVSG